MAEGDILYDSMGNPVGKIGRSNAAGMFVMEAPTAPPSAPAAAPGISQQDAPPQDAATTQQVQGTAEFAAQVETQGGDQHVPFGPVITIEEQDGQPVDPGFRYTWTPEGARRTFRIAPSIGLMPLLRFAHAAKAGMDSTDLEGMAALYDMIADCVHPDDWTEFMSYATLTKAEDEDLMEFVGTAMEIITARPRKPRGNSSGTSPRTSARSRGDSSRQALDIPAGAITPAELDGLMPVADMVK